MPFREGPKPPLPRKTENGEYEQYIGGEQVAPTAVLVTDPKNADGTISTKASWERGWLSAITRASKRSLPANERMGNIKEIVKAAAAAGVPHDRLEAHLQSLNVPGDASAVISED